MQECPPKTKSYQGCTLRKSQKISWDQLSLYHPQVSHDQIQMRWAKVTDSSYASWAMDQKKLGPLKLCLSDSPKQQGRPTQCFLRTSYPNPRVQRCLHQGILQWTPGLEEMGSCHRTCPRLSSVQYQGLPPSPSWAEAVGWLPGWEPQNLTYMLSFKVQLTKLKKKTETKSDLTEKDWTTS